MGAWWGGGEEGLRLLWSQLAAFHQLVCHTQNMCASSEGRGVYGQGRVGGSVGLSGTIWADWFA